MIETLLSLMGGGLGGLLRFVPEIFKFFNDQRDRDQEYRMTLLQLEIDKARSQQNIDLAHAQGDVAEQAGMMQAYVEAIKGQSVMSGVRWVDALSQSVRPVLTYWWQLLFTFVKVVTIWMAVENYQSLMMFIRTIWTDYDSGILAMIIGFWFVDRALKKMSQ